DCWERSTPWRDGHFARKVTGLFRFASFVPRIKKVGARGNVRYRELSRLIRHRIPGRVDNDDRRAHFRMDIAEDVANSWRVERERVRSPGLVESEVESLAVEQRKDVMKERIEVWKIDDRADGNREDVGVKCFVLLQHPEVVTGRCAAISGVPAP